jgi:hypothetical protein
VSRIRGAATKATRGGGSCGRPVGYPYDGGADRRPSEPGDWTASGWASGQSNHPSPIGTRSCPLRSESGGVSARGSTPAGPLDKGPRLGGDAAAFLGPQKLPRHGRADEEVVVSDLWYVLVIVVVVVLALFYLRTRRSIGFAAGRLGSGRWRLRAGPRRFPGDRHERRGSGLGGRQSATGRGPRGPSGPG